MYSQTDRKTEWIHISWPLNIETRQLIWINTVLFRLSRTRIKKNDNNIPKYDLNILIYVDIINFQNTYMHLSLFSSLNSQLAI